MHHQRCTFHFSTIADAFNGQDFLEPFADANNHVVDQRTGHAMKRAVVPLVRWAFHDNLTIVFFDHHINGELMAQLALRSLDGDCAAVNRDLNLVRDRNRFFPNS